ncbi:hypothetical protein [Oceanibacterium hippocampi]|uniref:hypothetical protein n=1 Tax=Oceanibacterium hippocampi TaxID=745714 RepID=UPI00111C867C|nr:hypothetical protein [Oceanibacterium hippocampi]
MNEEQGNGLPHGRLRADRPQANALIMEPNEFESDGEICLTWSVGIRAGVRIQTEYDSQTRTRTLQLVADPHIRFAPVLALPERGIMAIEDRSGDEQISARQAIGAFRTIMQTVHDGDGSFEVHHGDPEDIERWLDEWELKEYSYTIAPLNPISASAFAERRSEAMKRENVWKDAGKVLPPEGQSMQPNGGIIQEANELSEVGYGQRGFRGRTPDGHIAHVPKPRFHDDRHKNLAEQQKPHFVRVMFEPDNGQDTFLGGQVASALRRFYGG